MQTTIEVQIYRDKARNFTVRLLNLSLLDCSLELLTMWTTMTSKFFQGHGASSSSIEADYLTLSVESADCLARVVSEGLQLNERQCQDLSSKLVVIVENMQKLVPPSGALRVPFGPALKNLYRVLEKAKLLVIQCCDTDWCRAAVFQVHNEGAFGEVLLEVGLCYNVIYELTKGVFRDWEWTLLQAEDLRQSSLFLPASESEVFEDQKTLKRRLEHVAGTSDDRNSYLASYLLGKLEYISEARMNEAFSVPDALLWMNETEPQGTWKLQRVIGGGSGAICVCRYDWLGIPCARKEFHCRVSDVIFRREAAILALLNHPNIVKFFCCSNDPEMGRCFIAMELMEMSLDSLIESRREASRSFPIFVVLDIMTQIARGVCYLHGLNIAHRDLKPLNVVVTETRAAHLEDSFCVKLVDFGMSKTKVQVSKSNTISIHGVGTTKYRAPEVFPQAQRVAPGQKRKVNWFQADAYSFGITCAVVLSLQNPFEGVAATKLYEDLLQGVRPELPVECPEALVGLLKDCWATSPECRPGFAEICCRLEQCKLQELSRVSSEGFQGVVGSESIETVSMKQSYEQSLCATGVPYVQSECANTVSFNSVDAKDRVGISQLDEEGSSSSDDYYEDRQGIILSELEPKKIDALTPKVPESFYVIDAQNCPFVCKRVGLWSRTMSRLARVMSTDAILFKNSKESRYLRLKMKQKCEEADVKPTIFLYYELHVATQNFHKDMKLGEGGFGVVYKGLLPNGSVVAVKKSPLGDSSRHFVDEFFNEILFLTGVKHKNLVTLKGCCLHDKHWLRVYEYMEIDVSQILLDKGPRRQMVAWPVRLKICLGVAQGLHYLHALAHPRIIHRNIKASNVLLDRKLDPKNGGFDLALLFPDDQTHILVNAIVGTLGYIAPEYLQHGKLSDKVDVYSFGFLCLEIISGRRGIDNTVPQSQLYLVEWAWRLHKEDRLLELVDRTLHLTDVEVGDVQRVIEVCLMCVQNEAKRRPSMARIVSILQGDTEWDGQVLR